jgi:hypothetical protein
LTTDLSRLWRHDSRLPDIIKYQSVHVRLCTNQHHSRKPFTNG